MEHVSPADRVVMVAAQKRKEKKRLEEAARARTRMLISRSFFVVVTLAAVVMLGVWVRANSDPDPETFGEGFVQRNYLDLGVVKEACVKMVKAKYGKRIKQLMVDDRSSRVDAIESLMRVYLKAELYPYLGFRKQTDFYQIFCFSDIDSLKLEKYRMLKAKEI